MKTPANFRLPGSCLTISNIYMYLKLIYGELLTLHRNLLIWAAGPVISYPQNRGRFSMAHGVRIATLGSLFLFTACSSQPIIRVQYVTVKSYLPIPATLTAPIVVDLTGMTYGEGLGSLREGLERCDWQLAAIRVLTPPSPTHK